MGSIIPAYNIFHNLEINRFTVWIKNEEKASFKFSTFTIGSLNWRIQNCLLIPPLILPRVRLQCSDKSLFAHSYGIRKDEIGIVLFKRTIFLSIRGVK